ncbi:hypothetical protein BJ741DRAFT_613929 [Chytriomyces cf. hyalinus JEL632]|nr:hypothetical protein BJ741DRAFT_613929 [Chytriomyces cf. hyalinus JEL632]
MRTSEFGQQSHTTQSAEQSNESNIIKKVGYENLNRCYCSVLKIWQSQVDMNTNNLSKEQLRSQRVKMLLGSVQKRKKWEAMAKFEEKLDAEFTPYLLVNEIPRIEEELFRRNSESDKRCLGALRDRFCFLMSNGGILQGKSLFKCELSDLCDLVKKDEGVHDCHILVMRIAIGKTNGLKTLYGQVLRHKNVNLCPMKINCGLASSCWLTIRDLIEQYQFLIKCMQNACERCCPSRDGGDGWPDAEDPWKLESRHTRRPILIKTPP